MDAYTIRQLDDDNAILLVFHPSYRVWEDSPQSELKALYAALPEPYHFIVDFSERNLTLEDMLQIATAATRMEGALLKSPKVDRVFVVTQNDIMQAAARGLNAPIFGSFSVEVYGTLDEVLEALRDGAVKLRKAS
ncbi:MAG: hypothetical protein GYB68_06175 [Chloroflexi bacterium]|nr:hypothetical protein [Chloroflexota bacterium]